MDDVLIAGDTLEELETNTRFFLDLARKHKLSCKPVKAQFEKTSVKFLGVYISGGQTSVNFAKTKAILDWPTPTKLKDVESFLGTLQFWRKFIKDFSKLAQPLNELKRKGEPFIWTPVRQKAFDALKKALITPPILKIPRQDLPY